MNIEDGNTITLTVGDSQLRTFYYQTGTPTRGDIVLMHTGGVGVSAYMCWHPTLDALAGEGFRVTAPDAPGFGRTVVADGKSVAATDFLLALMDALAIKHAHLIGNSMGAMTIAKFASQHPERTTGLVLSGGEPRVTTDAVRAVGSLGATPRNDFVRAMFADHAVNRENVRHATADFFHDRSHPNIDYAADLRLDTLADDGVYRRAEEGAVRQLERKSVDSDSSYLSEINAPVFLLHGRDESWFYPEEHRMALTDAAMKAGQVIPNCTTTFLPFCGHWPQLEMSQRYNALVGEFLTAGTQS